MELRGVYDGVCYWWCTECGWAWHRFGPEFSRFERIDKHVKEIQDLYTKAVEEG